MPSDSGGNPVTNGGTDPSFWTAVGGFGGQSEAGDQVTSFAMCSTRGPAHTMVETASVSGVAARAALPDCDGLLPVGDESRRGRRPRDASFRAELQAHRQLPEQLGGRGVGQR